MINIVKKYLALSRFSNQKEKFEDLYSDVTDKYENLLHDAKGLVSKKEMK